MNITASALPRIFRCPLSAQLPQWPRTTKWAEFGTMVHLFRENVAKIGRDKALEKVPEEHRDHCAGIAEAALPTDMTPEVAFAYNPDSAKGRRLDTKGQRDYSSLEDGEYAGTADTVGLLEGGKGVLVEDLKTGWGWLPPIKQNEQLLFLAAAAVSAYGAEYAVIRILKMTDDTPRYYEHEVAAFDLDAFADDMSDLMFNIKAKDMQEREFSAHEGPWCKYCPAFESCPAKTSMVKALASPSADIAFDRSNAVEAYETLERAREALKRVEERIKEMVDEFGTITNDDGRTISWQETSTRRIKGDIAYTVMRDLYDEDAAKASATTVTKATQASIEKYLGKHCEKGTKAEAMRHVMAEIDARKGLSYSTSRKLKVKNG